MARPMPPQPTERAFTLVELSIVLVILGLLVGGVLAGQSLIKAASMRKTLAWNTQMQTSFMTFRDKYMALPGDMTNATSFWNRYSSGVCDSQPGTASTTGTCNGNGDGWINWNGGPSGENFLVWHHLSLSGIDPYGQTAGQSGGWAVYIPTPGQPRGTISMIGSLSMNAYLYPGAYPSSTPVRGVGLTTTKMCGSPQGATAIAEDVWQMDTKMDDGLPASGRFVAWNGRIQGDCATVVTGTSCLTGTAPNFTYNVGNTAETCSYLSVLVPG